VASCPVRQVVSRGSGARSLPVRGDRYRQTVRLLDPRIQAFFWAKYVPAREGDAEARRLVDALDEAASIVGCWPDEVWVLRGIYLLGEDRTTVATEPALAAALSDIDLTEVLEVLATPGLIRPSARTDDDVWAVTELGRMLLSAHQNEDEPAAAGLRFLQGSARDGALVPWRPRKLPKPPLRRSRARKRRGR
jgi:hypothetical protein